MEITLTGSAGSVTFDESDIVSSNGVRATKTHTGIADFQITLAGERDVEPFAARQDQILIEVESGTEFIGYVTDATHNIRAGTTSISGYGIAKRLEETRPNYESLGGSLTYSNISVQEALRDYWGRTEFDNYTVYDQPLETVAENELVQSADSDSEWVDVLPSASNIDVYKVENGELTLKPVTFFSEGESPDREDTTDRVSDGDLSNGDSIEVFNFAEYDFTVEHDIPSEHVGVAFRDAIQTETSGDTGLIFNGTTIDTVPGGLTAQSFNPGWNFPGIYDGNGTYDDRGGGDLDADTTYTFRIDGPGGEPDYVVDAVAVFDKRYVSESDFTETITNGYLDGPHIYPLTLDIPLNTTPVSFNISDSSVTSVINNTANNQAISVSNDDGDTYTSFNNTDSVDHSYSEAGREGKVRFTLGTTDETRDTATPRENFNAQAVDSFEHRVDGNNLAVLVDLELSKNHFDNLQTLHNKGDFVWNIEHDDKPINELVVESFKRGDQTKTLPVEDEIESNPEIAAENYYNSIYLQGALVNGSRPVAEVKDNDAISNDGREISPGVLRDLDVTTEGGAVYRARTLLDKASQNNALRGTKTYPADFSIQSGFSYPVDFGSGEQEFTLEELSLRYNGNEATVQLDFVPRSGLSEDVSELKRNSRQQSDRV